MNSDKAEISRVKAIRELLRTCIERGLSERAQEAARLLNRSLTRKEANQLIRANLEIYGLTFKDREFGNYRILEEAAMLSASTATIDRLVELFLECNLYDGAIKAVQLGASSGAIEKMLEKCLRENLFKEAVGAFEFLPRRALTRKRINQMLKICIGHLMVDKAQEIARLREEHLTRREIDQLTKGCIEHGWISDAVKAAKLGASPKIVEQLVEACIVHASIDDALEAARLAHRYLTGKERNRLKEWHVSFCNIGESQRVAELSASELSTEEIARLSKATKGRYFHVARSFANRSLSPS